MIYWKTLDSKRKIVLKKLCAQPFIKDFYLAGGTALSLELGLRKSDDFDFFTLRPFSEDQLYAKLSELLGKKPQVISLGEGTCDVDADGIQISFFLYPHRLLAPFVLTPELPGLRAGFFGGHRRDEDGRHRLPKRQKRLLRSLPDPEFKKLEGGRPDRFAE
jgi:hypothetical protein